MKMGCSGEFYLRQIEAFWYSIQTLLVLCHFKHPCYEKLPLSREHAFEDGLLKQEPNMQIVHAIAQ